MPHIHEKIDFCAEVFFIHNNRVLLRQHDKYKFWCSVGGHIELDEDPNQAAVREVKEEVGLNVTLIGPSRGGTEKETDLIPPLFVNRHRVSDTHEHVAFYYVARSENDAVVLSETERSDGCAWFTQEELEKNDAGVPERIQLYALSALAYARKYI